MMKRLLSVCLALIMLLSLVACGGGSNPTPAPTPDEQTVLKFPLTSIGNSMDPHPAQQGVDLTVTDQIYEGMFKIKDDGSLEPRLALSYEVSDDGLIYTYKLRQGVKFHNGDPLTVDDVVFSYQRCIDNKWRTSWLGNLVKVEATGDDTVALTLSAPNSVFGTSMNMVPVMCKKVVEEMGDNFSVKASAAGTGPYRFESYDPNSKIVLVANEDYYLDKPAIDRIEFVIITDAAAVLMALESGDIDFATVSANDVSVVEGNSDLTVKSVVARGTRFLSINTGNSKSPLYDKRVRQAIAYCINKEDMMLITDKGFGSVTDTFVAPAITDAPKNENMKFHFTRDIEKAKALLKEAGYENGFDLVIQAYNGGVFTTISECLVDNLEEIGIRATIVNGDSSAMLSDCQSNPETTYDIFVCGWTWGVSYNEYMGWYREDVSHLPHADRNEEFDRAAFEQIRNDALSAKTLEERAAKFAEADEYLTDFCSIIPLWYTMNNQAWNKNLNPVNYSLRPYIYEWSWN